MAHNWIFFFHIFVGVCVFPDFFRPSFLLPFLAICSEKFSYSICVGDYICLTDAVSNFSLLELHVSIILTHCSQNCIGLD